MPATARRSRPGELGQATVELVALLPLMVVLGAVLWQAVLAGQAIWFAGSAARAAARASAIGADARAAARRVLPDHLEDGLRCAANVATEACAWRSRSPRLQAPAAWAPSPLAPASRTKRDDRISRHRRSRAGVGRARRPRAALVRVVLSAAQLLAAGAARELAGHAAEAAAVALLQGADPRAAARDALPGWSRERMAVRIDGRKVRVRLRPASPIGSLAELLEARAEADAGPEAP